MQKLLRKTINEQNSRIHSGVIGFDKLVNGGFREYSVNVIIADPGCGKSTFCWQYCSDDLHTPALYVSLEQNINSVLRDCSDIGLKNFNKKYREGNLQFQVAFNVDSELTSGEIGLRFFMNELPKYLEVIKETASKYSGGIRIAIDPLTPLLLEISDPNQQRNAINRIFSSLREIGTSVITLEKGFGDVLARIPLFLSDSIIELEHIGLGGIYNRTLSIRKFRGSSHSETPQPIGFQKDKGLIVYDISNA
ncbi:MAG: RAD55 family ATPase [Candidatus Hodarchaeales archaeon]|jgi:KaiC/GvpD/RAD55 family RecA-like ATPase